ncbi:MAG: LexA family protein [Planctomycetaceae bacterium]
MAKLRPLGSGGQQNDGDARRLNLTRRQREIYDYLRDRILNHGLGPTVREIGLHFDIRSPNGVMCHLRALERKGLITRGQNMSRSIQLASGNQQRLTVRYIGTAASSGPIQPAVSSDDTVSFHEIFHGRSVGCVKIDGSHLNVINIADGDHLLIDSELPLAHGAHVAALDDRHSLIICVVQEGAGQLVPLIPGSYTPTTRQVLGVIVAVIRGMPRGEPFSRDDA